MYGTKTMMFILGLVGLLSGLGHAVERIKPFGNGIPLALIDDLLPADEIKIEFAEDVDRNVRIDWVDSDNWMLEFLQTLDGIGLRAVMKSKSIVIENLDDSVRQESDSEDDSLEWMDFEDESHEGIDDDDGIELENGSSESSENSHFTPENTANLEYEPEPIVRKGFRYIPLIEDLSETKPVEKQREDTIVETEVETDANPEEESNVNETIGGLTPKPTQQLKPELTTKPVVTLKKMSKFHAKTGDTLSSTLQKWGEEESWTLRWESTHDYILEADAVFEGDFISVTSEIVAAMANVRPPILVKFYSGNKVLRVSNNAEDFAN